MVDRSRRDEPSLIGGEAPLPLATAALPRGARGARWAWVRTRMGVFCLAALAAKALHMVAVALVGPSATLEGIGVVISVALVVVLAWGAVRLSALARRRLLWRVRRKLILSYVFVGFVPVLLIIAFFLFAGLLMFFHVSAYLFKRGIDDVVDEAVVMAETTASELRRSPGRLAAEVLERKQASAAARHPQASVALVPRHSVARMPAVAPVAAGPWAHLPPPTMLPDWVGEGGFGGLLAYPLAGTPDDAGLVIRAVGLPEERNPAWAIIVDLPVDERVLAELRETTGIDLTGVGVVPPGGEGGIAAPRGRSVPTLARSGSQAAQWSYNSVTIFDYVDWQSGRNGTLTLAIRVSIREIYDRISAAQSRIGTLSLGELFMAALGAIALLFLIIEAVALVMGFALARSITGSIHQLFQGTERVRLGDLTHRIRVTTRDQLGELADSFNDMTASIEVLLRQREEKKRLEEELRIAREIQMSLLPRGAFEFPGLTVTALCVPAREVGGDYYDFFPLDQTRVGLLIADVAGKGTSAALYMAELKGLMLSLSRTCDSPKRLLVEVNRILSDHLDSRSFITMTYAVIDVEARTLTYARAGHTPLIHLPMGSGRGGAQLLAPQGLVLGLRIEGIARKFEQLLVESQIHLQEGDVLVLFTDGITEAMNAEADLFGESRLLDLVEQHADQSTDVLRERILREIEAFVGAADQHDDMTMILIKVGAAGLRRAPGGLPALAAVPRASAHE